MTKYPLPEFESTFDLFTYANTVGEGWFTPGILLALFIVIFTVAKTQQLRTSVCMVIASTGCFIMGSLFWAGGTLSGQIVVWLLAVDGVCFIWAKFDE